MFKNKIKASLIHLGISFILVSLILGGILYFFFPSIFIEVSDFTDVAKLIISIDLILGPLLTFVIFQPEKKSLKFDLSIIAAIQVFALAYGAFALFQVHPVFVSFNVDRFTIVTAKDAEPEKIKNKKLKGSKYSAGKMVFAKMPEEIEKRNNLIFGGEDLEQKEEYYEPVIDNISAVLAKSIDPEIIFSKKNNETTKEFLDKHGSQLSELAFLPINSYKKDAIIVIDKKTAKPITTLAIDPWELTKK